MIYKMEMWRQMNNQLAALYHDEVPFASWLKIWERFGPVGAGRTFNPRIMARWYIGNRRVA